MSISTVAPDGSEHFVTEPITDQYVAGLKFAADIAHAEARWQTELRGRASTAVAQSRHSYAADRATEVENAIRAVMRVVTRPGGESE